MCVAFFALTLCYILLSFLSIPYGVYTRDCSWEVLDLSIYVNQSHALFTTNLNTFSTEKELPKWNSIHEIYTTH